MLEQIIEIRVRNSGIPAKIEAVQRDSGRVLKCNIIDMVIPSGATARIYGEKPSGLEIYNDCVISGNQVIVELTTQFLAEIGIIPCQIEITNEGEKVTSFDVFVNVKRSRASGSAIESKDEFTAIDNALKDAEGAAYKAVSEYAAANGLTTGATPEQAEQIKQNTLGVNELKEDIEQLKQGGTGTNSGATTTQANSLWYIIQKTAFSEVLTDEEINDFKTAWGITTETIPATGITLNKTTLSFADSATQTLIATVEPSNSTDKVTWESSNTGIATVLGGVVTPVSNGICTVTAKAGNYFANCAVTVNVAGETTTYTVTNNLTNVSTDNPVTTINKNSGYMATLIPDSGYEFSSVTVIMGGSDITSTVYSNGVITIDSVTGNVVITASAVLLGSTEEIILLKSITGDGNSYIDTEFVMDSFDYRFEFDIQTSESSDFSTDYSIGYYFFGADMYNVGSSYHSVKSGLTGKTQLLFNVNGKESKGGSWNMPTFFADQIGYCVCKNGFAQVYTDDTHETLPGWNSTTTGTATDESILPIIPCYLFRVNYTEDTNQNNVNNYSYGIPKKMTFYNFRIYKDSTNTLMHEYLPAKQGSKIGMYDTVTQKFHENKGTGTFGYEEVSA